MFSTIKISLAPEKTFLTQKRVPPLYGSIKQVHDSNNNNADRYTRTKKDRANLQRLVADAKSIYIRKMY